MRKGIIAAIVAVLVFALVGVASAHVRHHYRLPKHHHRLPVTSTTVPAPSTTVPPISTTTAPLVTTVPQTTTVLPSTSATEPSAGSGPADWPTAADSGATGSLSAVSGEIKLDTDGMIYSDKRVNGDIIVHACNVTIRNVEVDAGESLSDPVNDTPDLFAIWAKEPATCNLTLDHVTVLTDATTGVYATEAVRVAFGGPVTIKASKFIGQQLGVTVGSGSSISDTYIELGQTMRGDHNEAILDDGIDGLTLTHNTFLNQNGQTSALSLFNEFGPNSNFVIRDNLLAGGGYTCYCGDGVNAPASNVSFIDNVFWRKYFPNVGEFAAGRAYNPADGGQWTGNVFMDADGTLTTELVPQPPLDH